MKKLSSLMVGFGITACAFSGCVEDSQNVILKGLSASCEPASSDLKYELTCALSGNVLAAHIKNNITGTKPWSSSGGSSSGSTFETTVPNQGMIYIDEVVIRCENIDGNKDACKGKAPIKLKDNFPVGSSGGACMRVLTDEAGGWGDNVFISIQVSYHDSSLISGKTGKSYLTLASKYPPCIASN